MFDLTADAMAVKEEVSRMQEVKESTVKVDNYLRSEYLSALQKELAIAKVCSPDIIQWPELLSADYCS